jgi:3-(3-hydroxy-phenyl)propionate hydroxylase
LSHLGGQFTALAFGALDAAAVRALQAVHGPVPLRIVLVSAPDAPDSMPDAPAGTIVLHDTDGLAAQRYDARPGTLYLIRPDQHVCARWRSVNLPAVEQALQRAMCRATGQSSSREVPQDAELTAAAVA